MRCCKLLLPFLAAILTMACTAKHEAPPVAAAEVAPVLDGEDARDIHSYAQPAVARVTHVDLDLTADFDAHAFTGSAALDVQATGPAPVMTLDTRKLTIEAVTDGAGKALHWELGKEDAILGTPLRVTWARRDAYR